MTDIAPIRRALISVSDKSGLLDFARALAAGGVEILSTGGTATALREAGIAVKDVSAHTGFPEILDGRVKTLVPQVHGGLLGRRDLEEHRAQMAEGAFMGKNDIGPDSIAAIVVKAGFVPKDDYDAAIKRAESAESALATATQPHQ